MNAHQIIHLLEKWSSLIHAYNSIQLDLSSDQASIDGQLNERQQIIDSLQHLDAGLTEIREQKAAGWPDIDVDTVRKIEKLIEKGNAISICCVASDQKSLEIATSYRKEVSGQIGNVRKSKGYLTSSHMVKQRPSIIVDSHA